MVSFSVVIPTRDRPEFLKEAVRSILAQDHPAAEIVIVNDGTVSVDFIGAESPLVRVLDNGRRGPVAARNLGVRSATSDVIAFLDDDDRFADTGYLSLAARAFDDGADFCFGDGMLFFPDGRPGLPFALDADVRTLERDNTILISAVSFRRSLHEELGGFDEALPYYWDWDWYLRVARAGKRLRRLARPVVDIRVHDRNMSGGQSEVERRANLDRFARKHGLPPLILKNHLGLAEEQRENAPAIPGGRSA